MQTLMEERIKQAFAEWKKADQQLAEEVKTEPTKPKEESNMAKGLTGLSQQILAYIIAHPGVTGTELRRVVAERMPDKPISYVPACLKNMTDAFYVRRTPVANGDGQMGRSTYAYYALTEEERTAERNRPKSRAVKVVKVKKAKEVITPVLAPPKPHAVRPLEVGPTTISIAIQTSNGVSYSLSLPDAKYIYTQLNQIFGGAR